MRQADWLVVAALAVVAWWAWQKNKAPDLDPWEQHVAEQRAKYGG